MITAQYGGGLERDVSGLYERNVTKFPTQTGQTLGRNNFRDAVLLRASILEVIQVCATNRGNEYSCVKTSPVFSAAA